VKTRVWLHDEFKDFDAAEREDRAWTASSDGRVGGSVRDPREAAKLFAVFFHNRRDGWECTWPIDVVVHDGAHYWIIQVNREMVPEFWAEKPKPLVVAPDELAVAP
jgi:hypothetical protein